MHRRPDDDEDDDDSDDVGAPRGARAAGTRDRAPRVAASDDEEEFDETTYPVADVGQGKGQGKGKGKGKGPVGKKRLQKNAGQAAKRRRRDDFLNDSDEDTDDSDDDGDDRPAPVQPRTAPSRLKRGSDAAAPRAAADDDLDDLFGDGSEKSLSSSSSDDDSGADAGKGKGKGAADSSAEKMPAKKSKAGSDEDDDDDDDDDDVDHLFDSRPRKGAKGRKGLGKSSSSSSSSSSSGAGKKDVPARTKTGRKKSVRWSKGEDAVLKELYPRYRDAGSVYELISAHPSLTALGNDRGVAQVPPPI